MLQVHEFSAADHFTFCNPDPVKNIEIDCSEEVELREWAKRIEASYGFRLGAWDWEMPRSQENYGRQVGDEVRWLAQEEVHNSEVVFPQLWKGASPTTSQTQHSKHGNPGKYLCQSSQLQEIAKYQKEMLDMIQDVPEFVYELSLRDIVELPNVARAGKESPIKVKEEGSTKRGKRASRSGNVENRSFLLKVFFPSPLGERKNFGSSGVGSKASPKPNLTHEEKDGPEKNESVRSSRSSSTSSTKSRRKMRGCYPFL